VVATENRPASIARASLMARMSNCSLTALRCTAFAHETTSSGLSRSAAVCSVDDSPAITVTGFCSSWVM
jgi:hypothetical protein